MINTPNNIYTLKDDFETIIKENSYCYGKKIKITPSVHGKSSFVFFVNANDNYYIYKFPRTTFSAKTISKERIIANVLRNNLLYQIPDIFIDSRGGREFGIYKMIEGENMSDVYLDDIELQGLAKSLANFIFDFHSIPIETITYNIGTKRESLELFCSDFDYAPNFNVIKDILNEKYLIHGDYHRSNILLKNKELYGILDFATVSLGSKYFDIGHMLFSMNERFNRLFIEEYEFASNSILNSDKILRVIFFLDEMINKNYLPFIRRSRDV